MKDPPKQGGTALKILIVEDDPNIHELLIDIFKTHTTYQCTSVYSGTEAMLMLKQDAFDLMILDLILPGLSGEEVLVASRESHRGGIIVLSAKTAIEDKVELLGLGADDYLTKPFHQAELLARVESVLRRYGTKAKVPKVAGILEFKELRLNPNTYEAMVGDSKLHLTATEFQILLELVENQEQVFTKEQLYRKIWDDDVLVLDNAINVHISNLRKKIAAIAADEPYIETVWGIGYKMAKY